MRSVRYDVMAVILSVLVVYGSVSALRAWARSRHREMTIADRLLASLLTAGALASAWARQAMRWIIILTFFRDHLSVPVHVLVFPMLAKPGTAKDETG